MPIRESTKPRAGAIPSPKQQHVRGYYEHDGHVDNHAAETVVVVVAAVFHMQ